MPATTHASIALANLSRRKEITGELRQIDEAATTDQRSYTEQETARIAEVRSELEAIDQRITSNLEMEIRQGEIERGTADLLGDVLDRQARGSGRPEARTVGSQVAGAEEYRQWAEAGGQRGHFGVTLPDVSIRAVTDITLDGSSAGAMVETPRLPGVRMETPDRPVALLDLLPHIPVSQAAVEYVRDITAAADLINRPDIVPEGGAKPDASVNFEVITEAIKTIAVHTNITRQAAADVPQMQGYIDGRLRYALRRKADQQVIGGTGVGNDLTGLLNRSGINTYAPSGAEARYRSIRHAITMLEEDEQVPEIIVMHPQDAEYFDLSNDTTAGLHATLADGGIRQVPARTAWGLRQVRSTAVSAGTALLIDPIAAAVFDRQMITAYTSDSHGTNFVHNVITLLIETRLGVGLFQPQGVARVTFNGTV